MSHKEPPTMGIRSEDLMRGNFVLLDGEIRRVRDISYRCVMDDKAEGSISAHYTDLSPIPLTPSILEAAGFVSSNNYGNIENYEYKGTDFAIGLIRYVDTGEVKLNDHKINSRLAYVHELQNLYYWLCRRPLTIDLTKVKDKV